MQGFGFIIWFTMHVINLQRKALTDNVQVFLQIKQWDATGM